MAVESVDPLDVVFAMVQTDFSPLVKLDPLLTLLCLPLMADYAVKSLPIKRASANFYN